MSDASKTSNLMRFLGTLNEPAEKYPDFMAQDWLQAAHSKAGALYTNG